MADVFVSYARTDKARVAPLVAAIEAQGWSVWWDPKISPGQEFDRQISAANMRYSFACALSVHLKQTDAAIDMLEPVLARFAGGFLHHAQVDPDLDPLRVDPRFRKMLEAAEVRIAAAGHGSS